MKRGWIIILLLCIFIMNAWAKPIAFPFKAPFVVKDAVIYDQEGKKVKLWGVNYLAPFNHNFVNIQQSGADMKTAIDTDIAHFKLMNIDFIRIHLYDREITDAQGRLINNEHMQAFDYLIEQAFQNGIFVMLTPTVWWNTIENEKLFRENYSYWDLSQQQNFGFSNYFAKDAIIWHPEAIACQKQYLRSLFKHPNAFTEKTLSEYSHIVTIELTNEPKYVNETCIDKEAVMGSAIWKKGKPQPILKPMYETFAAKMKVDLKKPELTRKEMLPAFRAELLKRYFAELWPIVDEAFPKGVIKSHIYYQAQNPVIADALTSSGVEAVNLNAYWNATGKFDGGNTDWNNFLEDADNWLSKQKEKRFEGLAKIIYEFGASSSLDGYVVGAFAATFRSSDIQMAAFFTYTPAAVAPYNPGWLVHYLNIEHTPNKAAAFAAAGEIYRGEITSDSLKRTATQWTGETFNIKQKPSNVDFYVAEKGDIFRYAASTDRVIKDTSRLKTISGRGNSCVVSCNGSGSYYLQKTSDTQWKLTLFANHKYVNDPNGAKTFRHMANRYMNIDNMPVVSRLLERAVVFNFKLGRVVNCVPVPGGRTATLKPDGELTLFAGEYLLTITP